MPLNFGNRQVSRGTLTGVAVAAVAVLIAAIAYFSPSKKEEVAQAPKSAASAAQQSASAASASASAASASAQAASAVAQASASAPAATSSKTEVAEKGKPPVKAKKHAKKEDIIIVDRPVRTHKVAARPTDMRSPSFSVFDTVNQCEAVREAGMVQPYHPSTKAPFQGGPGWTEEVVPPGGACLGGAYVLEDGVPVRNKSVFVEGGFRYFRHTSGAYRMAECSNPFEYIQLAKARVVPPAPPAPVAQETPVSTTVIEEKKVLKVVPYCELPDGTQVKATIQNGEAVCPDLKYRAPVAVDQPIRIQPRMAQVPPVYTPPIVTPTQPQGCTGGNCAPPRRTEAGRNGICRIKAGTNRVPECNFPWKVLHTQDDLLNCGCQILVPNPRQIIGFPDAMPGSPRCLQQKKLWAEIQGLRYSDTRGN